MKRLRSRYKDKNYVEAVQTLVNHYIKTGTLNTPKLKVDGSYGPKTRKGVEALQKAFFIEPADGYFGPDTACAINTDLGFGYQDDYCRKPSFVINLVNKLREIEGDPRDQSPITNESRFFNDKKWKNPLEKEMKKNILEEVLRKQIREILSEQSRTTSFLDFNSMPSAGQAVEMAKKPVRFITNIMVDIIQSGTSDDPAFRKVYDFVKRSDARINHWTLAALFLALLELHEAGRIKPEDALKEKDPTGRAYKIFKSLYKLNYRDQYKALSAKDRRIVDHIFGNLKGLKKKKEDSDPVPGAVTKAAKPGKKARKKKFRWRKCRYNSRGGVRYGCYGLDVQHLQTYLNLILKRYAANYKPLKADGYFGRKTIRALKQANQLTGFPALSGNYVDKARMKAIVAFWNKMSQPKKQRPAAPKKSAIDRAMDKGREEIADELGQPPLKEHKFSNDKELQNLMESFKKFTRND